MIASELLGVSAFAPRPGGGGGYLHMMMIWHCLALFFFTDHGHNGMFSLSPIHWLQ
jgi:hypothetical protein